MCAGAQRDRLLTYSRTHFASFDAHKKLWLSARALGVMQRMLLYAKDELGMSTLRLQLRAPRERLKPHEALYKLHPAEVPVKNVVNFRCGTSVCYKVWPMVGVKSDFRL